MIVFDIETGPRPDDELRPLCPPFDPLAVKGLVDGEFDPQSVKLGNVKDQAKIDAKITEARAAFEAAKANNGNLIAAAEQSHWESFVEKAALSPVTGRVLAIGYYSTTNGKTAIQGQNGSEADLLAGFWRKYGECRKASRKLLGFNINRFDIPFLARRSWYLGVDVPEPLFDPTGRYLDKIFVDLLPRWSCGVWNESIKLGDLAQFFGVGGKPDGINGGDFARLWFEDRPTAVAYLRNDLEITAKCAARMGFV